MIEQEKVTYIQGSACDAMILLEYTLSPLQRTKGNSLALLFDE